jgi:hypothetical protein
MSREARVGRTMFDFKDVLMNSVTNKIVESLHHNNVNLSVDQRNKVISEVQTEVERLFNNATDSVVRAVRD